MNRTYSVVLFMPKFCAKRSKEIVSTFQHSCLVDVEVVAPGAFTYNECWTKKEYYYKV